MSRTAQSLLRLLERERALLRAGDVTAAAALLAPKSELAEALERDGAEAEILAAIRRAAERNAPLLAAARDGARAAERVVRALAGGVTTQTYSAAGHCTEIGGARRRLERRA